METVRVVISLISVILIGYIFFRLALYAAQIVLRKPIFIRAICKDFRQKIWMTLGIGIIFFVIYLLIAFGLYMIDSHEYRLKIFFAMYRHPTEFVYLGLFVFAITSATIYCARRYIIYFYKSRNK